MSMNMQNGQKLTPLTVVRMRIDDLFHDDLLRDSFTVGKNSLYYIHTLLQSGLLSTIHGIVTC